jgi:hypothetical protein
MAHYDKLFAAVPINKQTAIVVQSGNEIYDERKALVAQANYLRDAIKSAKQHRHMKLVDVQAMGRELQEVSTKLKNMKAADKFNRNKSVPNVFMDVCRDQMSRPQFNEVLKETYRRIKEDNNDQ